MLKISVRGLDGVFNLLERKLSEAKTLTTKAAAEGLVAALAKATPVDTGAASDSWRVEKTALGYAVASDSEYMADLNDGHSKQAPSRFIERTTLSQAGLRPNGIIVRHDDST
jgi:hypothetical protein